jgi:hypothetical protein
LKRTANSGYFEQPFEEPTISIKEPAKNQLVLWPVL